VPPNRQCSCGSSKDKTMLSLQLPVLLPTVCQHILAQGSKRPHTTIRPQPTAFCLPCCASHPCRPSPRVVAQHSPCSKQYYAMHTVQPQPHLMFELTRSDPGIHPKWSRVSPVSAHTLLNARSNAGRQPSATHSDTRRGGTCSGASGRSPNVGSASATARLARASAAATVPRPAATPAAAAAAGVY
jgi:hypothetical protein